MLRQHEVIVTATVTRVTDSVTPVTVVVIQSRYLYSRHGFRNFVTVFAVTVVSEVVVTGRIVAAM